MAEAQWVQLPRGVRFALGVVILVVLAAFLLLPALPLLEPVGTDVANEKIRSSAKLPILMWCLSWPIAFTRRSWLGCRTSWTFGCVFLLWHIAIAFHLGHGWSHAAAWEHTRQVGGYGDGVFVNYAFALVWVADVVWVWTSPSSYQTRPRWLHWSIHGFIAFVVFNAAFVFASWPFRITFLTWLLVPPLLVVLAVRYVRRKYLAPQDGTRTETDKTTDIATK